MVCGPARACEPPSETPSPHDADVLVRDGSGKPYRRLASNEASVRDIPEDAGGVQAQEDQTRSEDQPWKDQRMTVVDIKHFHLF
jgi:hypothetical protein